MSVESQAAVDYKSEFEVPKVYQEDYEGISSDLDFTQDDSALPVQLKCLVTSGGYFVKNPYEYQYRYSRNWLWLQDDYYIDWSKWKVDYISQGHERCMIPVIHSKRDTRRWMLCAHGWGQIFGSKYKTDDKSEKMRRCLDSLAESLEFGICYFNYGNTIYPTWPEVVRRHFAVLKYLKTHLNAKEVIVYGCSFGCGVQERGLKEAWQYLKEEVKLAIWDRGFADLEDFCKQRGTVGFFDKLWEKILLNNWKMTVLAALDLPIPHIVVASANVRQTQFMQHVTEEQYADKSIPYSVSLVKGVQDSDLKAKIIGIPEGHSDVLGDQSIAFLAQAIQQSLQEISDEPYSQLVETQLCSASTVAELTHRRRSGEGH